MADAVDKKLDMSLEQITDKRSHDQYSTSNNNSGNSNGSNDADAGFPFDDPSLSPHGYGGGKFRHTRRADRMAHSAPYQPRAPRYGGSSNGSQWHEQQSPPPTESRAAQRVYVGNLSWGVTWPMLKDHMRAAGDVLHVDILEANGRSKGCAVVTFATVADAEDAVYRLNDTVLDGRTIFVRNDREDRRARPNAGCRVYVGNLAWNIKWQDLKDHMKQVGRVVHADVLEEPSGRSKGCGLVEYSTRQEALAAIEQLTNTTLGDRMIFVREDREPDGGSISDIVKRTRSGVLGGPPPPPFVPPHHHVAGDYFGPPPPMFHHHPHHQYGPPPPFGPPHHGPHHHGFPPPYGPPPVLGGGERQIFIGNLPPNTQWKSLKDLFRTVGPVERAEVPEHPDGRMRGFGIVRFYNAQHAWEAIERYDRAEVNGHVITVRMDRNGQ